MSATKRIEDIVSKLTPIQKEKILAMRRPLKIGDFANYEKNCNFIINECKFALYEFDEVKNFLEKK